MEVECNDVPSLSAARPGSGVPIVDADPSDFEIDDDDGDDDLDDDLDEMERNALNALGTRTREPFGTRDEDIDDRDAELRERLGLGDDDDDEDDHSFPHGYKATHNKSMPGHLRLAERQEVRAAFAAMRDAGGRESADARRATATAADSGRARDHRAAAALHRDAAEHHDYEGNDEHAENHRVAAKYHSRMARKAVHNDSKPGHLRLAERREVQAAFAEMAKQGGRESAEARAATRRANESGSARDHRRAAAAHKAAAEHHRDEGDDDRAEEHQAASRYHQKRGWHASKRAARNMLTMAANASRKAVRIGSISAHGDAAHINRCASASAQIAGDRALAQVFNATAARHEQEIVNIRQRQGRQVTRNVDRSPSALYVGQGVAPQMGDMTFNAFYGPGDGDYLPVPEMTYNEFCSPALRQNTPPVMNAGQPYPDHYAPWAPLPLPTLWGYR
jgi:hypothetical protein